jgi:hypothetical protein
VVPSEVDLDAESHLVSEIPMILSVPPARQPANALVSEAV